MEGPKYRASTDYDSKHIKGYVHEYNRALFLIGNDREDPGESTTHVRMCILALYHYV